MRIKAIFVISAVNEKKRQMNDICFFLFSFRLLSVFDAVLVINRWYESSRVRCRSHCSVPLSLTSLQIQFCMIIGIFLCINIFNISNKQIEWENHVLETYCFAKMKIDSKIDFGPYYLKIYLKNTFRSSQKQSTVWLYTAEI